MKLRAIPPTYTITKSTAVNGSFTVKVGTGEVVKAAENATVTITPTASSGYQVDTVSVYKTDDSDTTVTVTNNTFAMLPYDVTVTVTYKKVSAHIILNGGNQTISSSASSDLTVSCPQILRISSGSRLASRARRLLPLQQKITMLLPAVQLLP